MFTAVMLLGALVILCIGVVLCAQVHVLLDWPKHLPKGIVLLLILAWSAETPRRLTALHDGLTLWTDAAMKAPLKPRVHINLGDMLNKSGDPYGSVRELQIARDLLPNSPLAADRKRSWGFLVDTELGMFMKSAGRDDLAMAYLQEAARTAPKLVTWIGHAPTPALEP